MYKPLSQLFPDYEKCIPQECFQISVQCFCPVSRFHANVFFLYPLRTWENELFREYRKRPVVWNRLRCQLKTFTPTRKPTPYLSDIYLTQVICRLSGITGNNFCNYQSRTLYVKWNCSFCVTSNCSQYTHH